jgi:prophage maintenance system killer protein/DNA-binding protein YbaB
MSEIVIYEQEGGAVEVQLDGDTVWLRQEQMADLFKRDRTVIGRHIRNAMKEDELDLKSNVQNLHIAGSDKPVQFYDLNVIISVGYRVNSPQGVRFRQWATRILKEHLTQGYTLNQQRFECNARELEEALRLVQQTANTAELTADAGRGLVDVIGRYTQTFLLLQRYDEGLLTEPTGTTGGVLSSMNDVRKILADLKADLQKRGEASDLFARERGDALEAIFGNLEQTVFGNPAYPTIESKAAHLLYFVIKNHPLSDGNKRSGACLFVDFLHRNGVLIRNGQPVINDIGLAALALLVAESAADQKEVMIHLIMNMLAPPRGIH